MAIRIPVSSYPHNIINTNIRSRSSSCSSDVKSSASSIRSKAITSSLKQQRKLKEKNFDLDLLPHLSPLQLTEEIASSFDLDVVVHELERLFNQPGAYPPHPYLPGPSSPSTSPGFSGHPVRVAYQGVRGSYCQEAAVKAFSPVCNAFPCIHMEDAFQALEDRTADRAIVPAENSIDGTIDRNFDLLLRHDNVEIAGELILPVNHCLLAVPGACRSDLKRIVSHPQALSHCKTKLELMALDVDEVPNAAEAARFVSENGISDTAVIGSVIAAKEFGLQAIEQNFQDQIGNFNRFLQLGLRPVLPGRRDKSPSGTWKTTVAFSLEKGVSDLFRALWHFESRNIAVTRVEHRPNQLNPVRAVKKETGTIRYFEYIFILDLEGKVSDPGLKEALIQLDEISGFCRVLGSYSCT
ncbi:PREDICTED: arogenate dehydratase/prephenate dehydratase 2, chloroplastic-like [Nelumbo nucifera]|uniref:Arogenate dehydratase/prephenate dehydratase 2, chloroplastic-like n=2 Tax=Nelumbo nucifera TaxID=4432 RepID=A0A1U7Z0A9_NELNU|nr:PREDICTED: arogenate dehydratase/prephenate dehydratase 2, chloroplastic-like [Nelumbo nucifera]DAD32866.1 TPA_asm: hypothetical protein HUJ06_011717 [Nelumbo nucifera]